jgi:hypothetical protein
VEDKRQYKKPRSSIKAETIGSVMYRTKAEAPNDTRVYEEKTPAFKSPSKNIYKNEIRIEENEGNGNLKHPYGVYTQLIGKSFSMIDFSQPAIHPTPPAPPPLPAFCPLWTPLVPRLRRRLLKLDEASLPLVLSWSRLLLDC